MIGDEKMLRECILAVRLGSLVATRVEVGTKGVAKADKTPVTVADYAVQAVISHVLKISYPDIKLLAEEDGEGFASLPKELKDQVIERVVDVIPELKDEAEKHITHLIERGSFGKDEKDKGQAAFVLDPIDGTKGFLRGGQYAICLGVLEANAEASIGVLGCPNFPNTFHGEVTERGFLFEARKGHGANLRKLALHENEEDVVLHPLSVTGRKEKGVYLAESYDSSHTIPEMHQKLMTHFGLKSEDVIRIDSQCKFALLARGDAQIYPRITPFDQSIWDILPGYVLLTEAGGRVTLKDGSDIDFSLGRTIKSSAILATCSSDKTLHEKSLKVIQN